MQAAAASPAPLTSVKAAVITGSTQQHGDVPRSGRESCSGSHWWKLNRGNVTARSRSALHPRGLSGFSLPSSVHAVFCLFSASQDLCLAPARCVVPRGPVCSRWVGSTSRRPRPSTGLHLLAAASCCWARNQCVFSRLAVCFLLGQSSPRQPSLRTEG